MIAFSKFKTKGLGNRMFQYAFTRITAQKLGVKFYFPEWIGDNIFLLDDQNERVKEITGIHKRYVELKDNCGFNKAALAIEDGTDIFGYFQSELYYPDKPKIRQWFRFSSESISGLKEKYRSINFSNSVGLHFRFGDKKKRPERWVLAPLSYYQQALALVKHKKNILIFSDEMHQAKKIARHLPGKIVYTEGNQDYQDLYLMGLCHDNICSISTLSWWGAWLNQFPDKIVVCLKEWIRPGYLRHEGLTPADWLEIKVVKTPLGSYPILVWPHRIRRAITSLFKLRF